MTNEQNTVNILICGNTGVRDGMILLALSLAKNSSRAIRLFIGTMDLSSLDPKYTSLTEHDSTLIEAILQESCPDSEAILVDMREPFLRELSEGKNMQTRYTPYAMLRLCADEYPLPDKILYLDCDVIALSDVGELYDVDMTDHELAGALDRYGRWFISPRYMNSGIMLWNMARIRESGLLARARKMCRERKMLLCDQTALNRCVKDKLILPRKFNEQGDRRPDTKLQHFSMRIKWIPFRTVNIKPWQVDRLHDGLGVYYLDGIIERWMRIKNNGYSYTK